MSINGIGYSGILRPQTGAAQGGQRGERSEAVRTESRSAPTPGAAASIAPAGTDPELWSVLTSEERQFFEKAQSLGPVTYSPRTAPADTSMPRGSRLDLRV